MRKVYLLITSALMLLSSSTLWAASYTYNNVTYTEESELWEAVGDVASVKIKIGEASDLTVPAGKTVTLQQVANNQTNGTITNDGTLKLDYGTSSNKTWSSGTFVNNASLSLLSCIWDGASFINNNGGTLTISGGTLHNASFINYGAITPLTAGTFNSELLETLKGIGATIADGYECNTYYGDTTCKQILKSSNILARITTLEGNVFAFNYLDDAMNYSTKETPAVLQKNAGQSAFDKWKVSDGEDKYVDLNGYTMTVSRNGTTISHGSLNLVGNGTIAVTNNNITSAFWLTGSATPTSKPYASLSIGEGVTFNCIGDKASAVCVDQNGTTKKSYGVVVDIKGTIRTSKSYALYINGNIQANEGNIPEINIADGASIETQCDGEGACIYAAGYGKWTIGAATLKAATPIYAKAGIIEVNGTTINACGEFANARPNGNGYFSTGDGIVLDTKAGYAGNMQLLVTSATITSENAYAIQEVETTPSSTSQTINMTIQHGSVAGKKGAIAVSDDFAAIAEDGGRPDGTFVVNAVIGGKYSTKPTVIADGYEAVQIYGQEPFLWEVKAKTEASYTTKEFAETSYDEFTVPANEEYVVKNGQTITIGKLTIGNDADSRARVRVEPTGKLIIGEGGIAYNNNKGVESLLLESSNSSTGILMFNGASKLTSSILGTVEMYAHTRIIDAATNEYLCQHFGLPLYVGGASIEKNAPAAYGVWNVQNGWENVHSSYILNNGPWDGNNVTTNTENEGSLFKFKGCLVGNVDATYNFTSGDYGYKFFGNSYTAPMKMTELMNQYAAKVGVDGSVWDGTVWVFKPSDYETMGQHFVQWNGAEAIEENAMIDPLQGFFLRHESNEETSFTVEYSKAVLGYSTMGAEDVTVENKGKITITDGQSTASLNLYEGEGLSDDFDFNYDGYQMETGTIQIYVTSGGQKWSSFGSNSFDGKEIVIVSKANTEITMSFSKLGGNAFKLTDKASGAEVEVAADKTYKFTVEPNSTVTRFKLGEGEVSAEEADADAVKIWVAENNLNIAGAAEGDAIEVINLAGIKVLSAVATGEGVQTISLSGIASGAYIVKAGAATVKFVK